MKKSNLDYELSDWNETINEDQLSNPISVPSHYKKYTIEEPKVMVTKP